MKLVNYLVVVGLVTACSSVKAQIKVGSNPTAINANSILELEATNKGFLLPRVALTATDNTQPLNAFVNGMLVFNTATVGTGATGVTPGIYYSDGTKWVRLESQAAINTFWSTAGNKSINPSLNFLGTTDNNPLIFKTNDTEALRVLPDGKIGIGTATPNTTLDVNGQLTIRNVTSGNTSDSILVIGAADQVVKKISTESYVKGMQKQLDIVAVNGQQIFNTPSNIVDEKKVLLYRNGVMIGFTVTGVNSIKAEIAAYSGDEIRIVQLQ